MDWPEDQSAPVGRERTGSEDRQARTSSSLPRRMRSSIPGCRAPKTRTSAGRMVAAALESTPSRSLPRSMPRAAEAVARISSALRSAARAWPATRRPASVNVTRKRARRTRVTPSSSSSAAMAWLTPG